MQIYCLFKHNLINHSNFVEAGRALGSGVEIWLRGGSMPNKPARICFGPMIVKNFFGEEIEVDCKNIEMKSDCQSIKMQIAEKYGIPIAQQTILCNNGTVFLKLSGAVRTAKETRMPIPAELAELGCPQERFNYHFNKYGDGARSHLFPLLAEKGAGQRPAFGSIRKAKLEDAGTFVESMDEKEQDLIVKNVEEYIRFFLECDGQN